MPLTARERELKRLACACFESQRETLAVFGFEAERFRTAPRDAFDERPHP